MAATATSTLLAYRVDIYDMHCVVFSATPAKARWMAVKGYWEAYGNTGWPRPTAYREPCYDDRIPTAHTAGKCYSEEFICL